MNTSKFFKKVVAIVCIMVVLFYNTAAIYALPHGGLGSDKHSVLDDTGAGTVSSDGTQQSSTATFNPRPVSNDPVQSGGPCLFVEVLYVPLKEYVKDKKQNELIKYLQNKVINESNGCVWDGVSMGKYQYLYYPVSDGAGSFTASVKPMGDAPLSGDIVDFVSHIMKGETALLDTKLGIEKYKEILKLFEPEGTSALNNIIGNNNGLCPTIIWTVGYYEKHTSHEEYCPPSYMATDMSAWYTGWDTYEEFKNGLTDNDCKLGYAVDANNHVHDRIWLGSHLCNAPYYQARGGVHGVVKWGWDDFNSFAGRTYIATENNGNYYARGFWGPFGGELPESDPLNYSFYTISMPDKDILTSFSDDEAATSNFSVHLDATDEVKEKVKASISTGTTYTVTITADTVSYVSTGYATAHSNTTANTDSVAPWNKQTVPFTSNSSRKTTSFNGGNATCEFVLSAKDFDMLLNDEMSLNIEYLCEDTQSAMDAGKLQHTVKFNVTVQDSVSGVISTATAIKPDCETYGWNDAQKTNYNTWKEEIPVDYHEPWKFSTSTDLNVYAEIVANCVGTRSGSGSPYAADWNLSQGIPSTENLSIAAGGQAFCVDLAGFVHGFGNNLDESSNLLLNNSDNTKNSENASASIKRKITFKVTLTDYWGSDNPRCELSCNGHSVFDKVEQSISVSKPTDVSLGSETKDPVDWECLTCGASGKYIYTPGTDKIDEVRDPITNEIVVHEVPATSGSWSDCTHTCSWYVNFNCSTGTFSGSYTEISGYTVTSPADATYKQAYRTEGGTVKCGTKSYNLNDYSPTDLLCSGYTTGYGCISTHKVNCAKDHHGTVTKEFYLIETVDAYAYRELTSAKIYGLEKVAIDWNNADLVDGDYVGQSSSNANLKATMWRGCNQADGACGRTWFTQFVNPNFGDNSLWTSTQVLHTYTSKGGNAMVDTSYWLGDCVVNITACANSRIANLDNIGAIDDLPNKVNTDQGSIYKHWTEDSSHGTDAYQTQSGDTLSNEQIVKEACQIVNAWQNANKSDKYTMMVISDAVTIGVGTGNVSQNVLAESYAIDNGITLFNYGFTQAGETYYRNHRNIYGNGKDNMNQLLSNNFWDKYDSFNNLNNAETICYGYNGTTSDNPINKYGIIGNYTTNSFINAIQSSNLGSYNQNGEIWSANSIATGTNACYTAFENGGNPGVTEASFYTSGTASERYFDGYYTKYRYPYVGNYTVQHTLNGQTVGAGYDVTNNGAGNMISYSLDDGTIINYNTPLVISDIRLRKDAPNGVYESPIMVRGYYKPFFEFNNPSYQEGYNGTNAITKVRPTEYIAKLRSSVGAGVLNDVVIHDPVSNAYWQIIGNGYGDYDGSGPAKDETGNDMRVITANVNEVDKNNYIVVGNTFHLWVTDFGDFYDSTGNYFNGVASRSLGVGNVNDGSNKSNGVSNGTSYGYSNKMNTGVWVKERAVMFDFPVGCYTTSGTYLAVPAGEWINLGALKSTGFHAAPNLLNSVISWDKEFMFGTDYEFTVLTSAVESQASMVYYRTRAINEEYDTSGNPIIDHSQKQDTNVFRDSSEYKADSAVLKSDSVAIVGRIGNLALEDVGDFRFSNLFKCAKPSWLINGVIHDVYADIPNKILATEYDILGNQRMHTASLVNSSHATLSTTNYTVNGTGGYGKAGDWLELPLSAQKNNIPEYSTSQMHMGYPAYFDIETIGNYYGVNAYEGPKSAIEEKDTVDYRSNTMTILPHYYLYDYEEGKFYAIDLYSGASGNYTRFYSCVASGSDKWTLSSETSLYIDLPNESSRRNVTADEKLFTDKFANQYGLSKVAYKEADYIGTARKIVLDSDDVDYIGSPYLYGEPPSHIDIASFENNQLGKGQNVNDSWYSGKIATDEISFIQQSQRWYFTLTIPSSTIATYPNANRDNQNDILSSHEKLKEEHPNAVIVAFAEIKVVGTTYTLEYNALAYNGDRNSIKITLFGDKKPDGWQSTWKNEIVISKGGVPAYSDDKSNTYLDTISSKWAPLVVYDAYHTSNEDLDTFGTH